MAAKTSRVLRAVHRWLGVVLCLFMASWFASGIVLIYVPFPDLPRAERIAGSADIPLAEVRVSPTQALEHVSPKVTVEQIRLIAFGFRPAYVIHPRDGRVTAVWADSGGAARVTSGAAAKRLAEGFSGATALRVVGPFDTDQWVVHEKYTAFRPFYKVEMEGVDNTHLYVSQQSGEILQKTHGYERLWNYFGAVVHWIYPTFLRKNWVAWDQAVWWISLIGVIVTLIGIWLGIDAMRIARRGRRERSFLFSGWMRGSAPFFL